MRLDFKLCQEPGADNRLRAALSSTFNSLMPRLEALSPSAIVLTGSLSRGEGSAHSVNGIIRLNSDLEMIVIFSSQEHFSKRRDDTKRLAEDIRSCLKKEGVSCEVECSPAPPEYLLKLRPTIFTYEFMVKGRVVWGDESILSLIKPFSSDDIPVSDAFELVNNRIIEHLAAFQNILDGRRCDIHRQEAAAYSIIKMYMDMATAILVFLGRYEPTYEARAKRFQEVSQNLEKHVQSKAQDTSCTYITGLVDMVQRCTHFKLCQEGSALDFFAQKADGGSGKSSYDHDFYNQLLLEEWEKLSLCVRPVWVWMANKITCGDYTEDIHILASRMLRQEPLQKRVKGWAKLYLGLKGANRLNELQYMRLLKGLTVGSPESIIRYLGTVLYFYIHKHDQIRTNNTNDVTLSYIESMLPSYLIDSDRNVNPCLLIREVNYNYMKFVRFNYDLIPACMLTV